MKTLTTPDEISVQVPEQMFSFKIRVVNQRILYENISLSTCAGSGRKLWNSFKANQPNTSLSVPVNRSLLLYLEG